MSSTTPTFQRSSSYGRSGSPLFDGLHEEGDITIGSDREMQRSRQNIPMWSVGESHCHNKPENIEEGKHEYDIANNDLLIEEDKALHVQRREGEIIELTDTEKSRERRRAISEFVKEGDRRRRQRLKRNLLKVDEYRNKPYGVGLSFWRKDLSLLSRKLDPTIANIKKQPQGVIKEIEEWVQLTWEYTHPVNFEFVRGAVACGVTLRRAALKDKMKNEEPKPEDVSDWTWRTLAQQFATPETRKKAKDCSRANACRYYFGRTGPSREVGVRHKLEAELKRTPHPEEVQAGMSRDKGYGGRAKRICVPNHVMHGSMISIPHETTHDITRIPATRKNLLEEEARNAHAKVCKLQEKIRAIEAQQAQGFVQSGVSLPEELRAVKLSEQQLPLLDADGRICGALLSGGNEGEVKGYGVALFRGVESDLPNAAEGLRM